MHTHFDIRSEYRVVDSRHLRDSVEHFDVVTHLRDPLSGHEGCYLDHR
jgi:hypothetical protein